MYLLIDGKKYTNIESIEIRRTKISNAHDTLRASLVFDVDNFAISLATLSKFSKLSLFIEDKIIFTGYICKSDIKGKSNTIGVKATTVSLMCKPVPHLDTVQPIKEGEILSTDTKDIIEKLLTAMPYDSASDTKKEDKEDKNSKYAKLIVEDVGDEENIDKGNLKDLIIWDATTYPVNRYVFPKTSSSLQELSKLEIKYGYHIEYDYNGTGKIKITDINKVKKTNSTPVILEVGKNIVDFSISLDNQITSSYISIQGHGRKYEESSKNRLVDKSSFSAKDESIEQFLVKRFLIDFEDLNTVPQAVKYKAIENKIHSAKIQIQVHDYKDSNNEFYRINEKYRLIIPQIAINQVFTCVELSFIITVNRMSIVLGFSPTEDENGVILSDTPDWAIDNKDPSKVEDLSERQTAKKKFKTYSDPPNGNEIQPVTLKNVDNNIPNTINSNSVINPINLNVAKR